MGHIEFLRKKYSPEEVEALIPGHMESLAKISEKEALDFFSGMNFSVTIRIGEEHELKLAEFIPFLALVRMAKQNNKEHKCMK